MQHQQILPYILPCMFDLHSVYNVRQWLSYFQYLKTYMLCIIVLMFLKLCQSHSHQNLLYPCLKVKSWSCNNSKQGLINLRLEILLLVDSFTKFVPIFICINFSHRWPFQFVPWKVELIFRNTWIFLSLALQRWKSFMGKAQFIWLAVTVSITWVSRKRKVKMR